MTTSNESAKREELSACREQIAKIDHDIVVLLKRRVDLARNTGTLKREIGVPILDPQREAAVIRSAVEHARAEGLSEEAVREIFWKILGVSREAQQSEAE